MAGVAAVARMGVRQGGGKPQAVDTVPARIVPGAKTTQSREVVQPPPGSKAALIAPGEIINDQKTSADIIGPMVEEYERTGKVDGKPPSPTVLALIKSLQAKGDESGDPGEGAEGYCAGGKVGYAGGGVVGMLKGLFENPNVARNRQEIEQMQNGTYQGQPPSAPPPPAETAPATGGVAGAMQRLQGRGAQIDGAVDGAVGYAQGGLIPEPIEPPTHYDPRVNQSAAMEPVGGGKPRSGIDVFGERARQATTPEPIGGVGDPRVGAFQDPRAATTQAEPVAQGARRTVSSVAEAAPSKAATAMSQFAGKAASGLGRAMGVAAIPVTVADMAGGAADAGVWPASAYAERAQHLQATGGDPAEVQRMRGLEAKSAQMGGIDRAAALGNAVSFGAGNWLGGLADKAQTAIANTVYGPGQWENYTYGEPTATPLPAQPRATKLANGPASAPSGTENAAPAPAPAPASAQTPAPAPAPAPAPDGTVVDLGGGNSLRLSNPGSANAFINKDGTGLFGGVDPARTYGEGLRAVAEGAKNPNVFQAENGGYASGQIGHGGTVSVLGGGAVPGQGGSAITDLADAKARANGYGNWREAAAALNGNPQPSGVAALAQRSAPPAVNPDTSAIDDAIKNFEWQTRGSQLTSHGVEALARLHAIKAGMMENANQANAQIYGHNVQGDAAAGRNQADLAQNAANVDVAMRRNAIDAEHNRIAEQAGAGDAALSLLRARLTEQLVNGTPAQQAAAREKLAQLGGVGGKAAQQQKGEFIKMKNLSDPANPLADPGETLLYGDPVTGQVRRVEAAGGQSIQSGTVMDGHRFKGGNPADQRNWEKV